MNWATKRFVVRVDLSVQTGSNVLELVPGWTRLGIFQLVFLYIEEASSSEADYTIPFGFAWLNALCFRRNRHQSGLKLRSTVGQRETQVINLFREQWTIACLSSASSRCNKCVAQILARCQRGRFRKFINEALFLSPLLLSLMNSFEQNLDCGFLHSDTRTLTTESFASHRHSCWWWARLHRCWNNTVKCR